MTYGNTASFPRVMWVICEEHTLHHQSSNRVLALSHHGKGTFRVYSWMCRMLPKGHLGCPLGTQPLSSIIELSMHPIFNHREKGTLKDYPWLRHVLFKGNAGYPRETQPPSLIMKSSTCPIFNHREKGLLESFPGYAVCSPRVIWVVHRELALHLQSSNRVLVLALSSTITEKRL